jgi:Tol biopolymer transport system component
VSVGDEGTETDWFSDQPSVSGDGRYTAFRSAATNLSPGDTNEKPDVFVHDRLTKETTRVSVGSGGAQANYRSDQPSVSADGRYVAFESGASNLVSGDTNSTSDVFVHDRQAGTTTRVSVGSDGGQANQMSYSASVSENGRYIAFESLASNLATGDTNGVWDVFVHDRLTGTTERVSVGTGGTGGNFGSAFPSVSGDGRYIAFESGASNLVPGDTNRSDDVFVHDRLTGTTTRVSVGTGGVQADSSSVQPSVSGDGRYIAFESGASNLVPGDTNEQPDVFVHDRQTGTTTRVSVGTGGVQADSSSVQTSVSGDGRYIAFKSGASNLVPGDTNRSDDVFVHDRQGLGAG